MYARGGLRTSVPSCDGSSPRSNRMAAAGVLTVLMIHPYWKEGSTESAVPHRSVAEMDVSRRTLSSSSIGSSTCPPTDKRSEGGLARLSKQGKCSKAGQWKIGRVMREGDAQDGGADCDRAREDRVSLPSSSKRESRAREE
eukprot:6184910-Pleurochrysis_carterae.AAC.1